MKKYNLSSIMKRAWELVKKAGMTISSGLKKAWKEAKTTVKNVTMRVIGYEEFTINGETGVVTGKTYNARKFLKENFDAKWNPSEKHWTIEPAKLEEELRNCARYYEKYIVSKTENTKAEVEKTIVSEELVNGYDGFYRHVVYSDGTKKRIFVG